MTSQAYRIQRSDAGVPRGRSRGAVEAAFTVVGDVAVVEELELLVGTLGSTPPAMASAIVRALSAASRRTELDEEIIGRLMPDDVPSADHVLQLQRNAEARTAALREFGALTAAGLATARGSRTTNPHATAGRWLREGRLFAVEGPRERLYPGFQIEDGRPKAALARVLAALPRGLGGWEILLWFTRSDGRLGGRRPADLLDRDPDRVVEAAAHLASTMAD